MFIENLEKTRKRQLGDGDQKSELEQLLDATITPMNTEGTEMLEAPEKKDDELLDINTKRFSKKDHMFMSFFSKYGKTFIDNKRSEMVDPEAKVPDVKTKEEKLQEPKTPEDTMLMKERPVYNKA